LCLLDFGASGVSKDTCDASCVPLPSSYGCDGNGGVITFPNGVGACATAADCKCVRCNASTATCENAPTNASQSLTGLYLTRSSCTTACIPITYGCDGAGNVIQFTDGTGKCSSATNCKCTRCDTLTGTCSAAPYNADQAATNLYSSASACTAACFKPTYGCNGSGGITTFTDGTGKCGTSSSTTTCKCYKCDGVAGTCGPAAYNADQSQTGLYSTSSACTTSCFKTTYGCNGIGGIIPYYTGNGACGTSSSSTTCKCYLCNSTTGCGPAPSNVAQTTAGLYSSLTECNSSCVVIKQTVSVPATTSPSLFYASMYSTFRYITFISVQQTTNRCIVQGGSVTFSIQNPFTTSKTINYSVVLYNFSNNTAVTVSAGGTPFNANQTMSFTMTWSQKTLTVNWSLNTAIYFGVGCDNGGTVTALSTPGGFSLQLYKI
jgi:hypothetical protein